MPGLGHRARHTVAVSALRPLRHAALLAVPMLETMVGWHRQQVDAGIVGRLHDDFVEPDLRQWLDLVALGEAAISGLDGYHAVAPPQPRIAPMLSV